MNARRRHVVGVISDTHGLVRPEAVAALRGVDLVVHAGDIGAAAVLEALGRIAPVVAVRGNNDREAWARSLPRRATLDVGGLRLLVVHDVKDLAAAREVGDAAVVISGHSHRPVVERRGGVLFLNPGSAGPRRFTLPLTLARLEVAAGRARARIVTLDRGGRPRRRRQARHRDVASRGSAGVSPPPARRGRGAAGASARARPRARGRGPA